jgi:hypothetical protein
MRKIAFLALVLLFPGCGKFFDKFSRLDEGYTRVELVGDRNPGATLNGGVMVIFARSSDDGGSAFGFSSAELAGGRTVVVPNGSYKVLAYGAEEGTGKILQGQAKCGLGNGGALVNLSGGGTTVSIQMSAANCGFGTNSVFSDEEYTFGGSNLDTLSIQFCSTQVHPGCDNNVGATYRVKFRLSGGQAPAKHTFIPSEADSLTSGCSSAPTSGIISSSFLAFVGSETLSPPAELLIYNDGTCSGPIVGRIPMNDGLRDYRNSATGSVIRISAPASSNTTYLYIKYP